MEAHQNYYMMRSIFTLMPIGYQILIRNQSGGAIAWSSKKHNTVTPSTPKAKYIAATHVVKQVLWHWLLLTKLKFPLSTPSIIFSDNQLAIMIAHHPKFHTHTKYIDIALHFSWDHMNKGTLNMFYIKTNYNITDIFTKALTWPVHQNFTYELGIILVKGKCWDSDQHTHIVCCVYIVYYIIYLSFTNNYYL